jgi:tight adherence protein B
VSEPWFIYFLVFAGAALLVEAVYFAVVRPRRLLLAIDRRLEDSASVSGDESLPADLLRTSHLGQSRHPIVRLIGNRLRQTHLKTRPRSLVLGTAGFAAVLFLLLGRGIGYGVPALLIALTVPVIALAIFLEVVRARRLARFEEQLPDAVDIIVRGVRAGYPLPAAIALVGREMPAPAGDEFALVAEELLYGRDTKGALDNLYRRIGKTDLVFLMIALSVQERTGGNLLDVLSRLAGLIRRRLLFRKKIDALTAEGRLSALVLTLMPFVLAAIMMVTAPDYLATVRDHWIAGPAAIGGLLALLLGNVIIHRMVRFKV